MYAKFSRRGDPWQCVNLCQRPPYLAAARALRRILAIFALSQLTSGTPQHPSASHLPPTNLKVNARASACAPPRPAPASRGGLLPA